MKICGTIIILLWLVVSPTSSTPLIKNNKTIQKCLKRTGEIIAVDSLIQEYERKHQQFYKEKSKDGNGLQWPDLNYKNLSKYCREYLQHNMPSRKNEGAIGLKMLITLHYDKEYKKTATQVIVLHCIVERKSDKSSYYITRAPERNCVYTLMCTKCSENHRGHFEFNIINKYCDFEGTPLKNSPRKRKMVEIIKTINQTTGQPVANDEYLLQYELEHLELLKREACEGPRIKWPYKIDHYNLNSYCSQYLRTCAPGRNLEGVIGSCDTRKLYYQKIKTNRNIDVTVVTCLVPSASKRHYYMTRAPESNCVYALSLEGFNIRCPFAIIFKHCDFEDHNDQENILKGYDILDKDLRPKTEVKEEMDDTLETMQLFPNK